MLSESKQLAPLVVCGQDSVGKSLGEREGDGGSAVRGIEMGGLGKGCLGDLLKAQGGGTGAK
jgi:hypothetical protein